jgi:hypothetical protein
MLYLFLLTTLGFAAATYYYFQKFQQSQTNQHKLKERVGNLEREQKQLKQIYSKYDDIVSKEAFINKLDLDISLRQAQISDLRDQYEQVNTKIAALKAQLETLEEQENFQTIAFYQPKYDFQDSAQFQERLESIRNIQKQFIKDGLAVTSDTSLTIEGSRKLGQKMIQNFIKLVLRAFNGECDAAIAKIKHNNITVQENRIKKAFEALNKLAETTYCTINDLYLEYKLEELYLTHEYQEKKQQELEEQRRIREQMKEEERALREIEKAKLDAEKEEQRYQQALEKARLEIDQATGKQRDKLQAQILQLSQQLEQAHINKERAISRAQMTKAGHVYVISNIGAFGEHVYKIGMTRRLDPMDRVDELGDASVPFPFDVHAIIFSPNAPELENLLHKRFHHRRVNKVNERKEFFKVDLEEIAEAVKQIAQETNSVQGEIHITKTPAAIDYRKTIAMLEQTYQSK